jgi:sigma-B regulation protein RsbU (phosphoserine phosphatase)
VDGTLFPSTGSTGTGRDVPSRLLVTLRGADLAGEEPRTFLARLCRALADAFPIQNVVVHALDAGGNCSLLSSEGASPLASRANQQIASLIADGLPYVWLPPAPRASDKWARVGLALPRDGRLVGVLSLTVRTEEQEFLETLAPELVPFTDLAAAAVERAREAETRHREWLATLQNLSDSLAAHTHLEEFLTVACDALLRITGAELASVTLAESGDRPRGDVVRGEAASLVRLWDRSLLRSRLEARAARERDVQLFRGLLQEPGCETARVLGLDQVACLPLWRRERLLGVLSMGSVKGRNLSDEMLDLVRAVGRQLTVAIDHAVLIEQARRQMEEHRERSDEIRVLYDLSQAMVATNSLEDRLREVACALTRVTGTSHCAIFRREPDGLTPWVCVGASPDGSPPTAPDLPPEDVRRLVSSSSRGPFVTRAGGRDPFARSGWLKEQRIETALWLPLNVDRRIIGFMLCYQPRQATVFTPGQRRLAGTIASQAAMAIRMSQAYEHQRNIADYLQSGMRPTHVDRHGRFELESAYHPALQEARVGGDFFDVFSLPDGRVALLMADVSGKGLQAAVQTTMVRNMLRLIAFEDADPAVALGRLNRALYHYYTDQELFVTAFYGVLAPDSGELQYANAGHDPPLLYRAGLRFCTALDTTGMALGMDNASRYFGRLIDLERGDLLLLYTDGITEARRGADFFGRERLEDLLVRFADSRPTRIVRFLYRDARAFSGGALHDDVALLCLKARE